MTGEITLRGRCSRSAGSRRRCWPHGASAFADVILPRQNEKSVLEDIGEELRRDLTIHLVSTIEEVVDLALGPTPVAAPVIVEQTEPQPVP